MSDIRISRRDFLKLIGYGVIALSMGPFLNIGLERLRHLAFIHSAFAQNPGSRSQGPKTSIVAARVGSVSAADATRPGHVVGLTVTAASSTQLNLAWTANTETDLNHYNVYRGTTAGFHVTLGTTASIGTSATNLFSNTGLNPNTTYYYKVAAVDNVGNIGSLSLERSGTTNAADTILPLVAINSPANNAIAASNLLLVTGTASDYGGSGVKQVAVRIRASVVTPYTLAMPAAPNDWSTWSATLDLNSAGSTGHYILEARAVDNENNVQWSDDITVKYTGSSPDDTPPGQVVGLAVTAASSTQLNLEWTANKELDLNHYNVYRGTSSGLIVIPGITTPLKIVTANLFSNTGLNPNTTYYYKVAAVDNVGNIGSLSLERSEKTNPAGTRYSTI